MKLILAFQMTSSVMKFSIWKIFLPVLHLLVMWLIQLASWKYYILNVKKKTGQWIWLSCDVHTRTLTVLLNGYSWHGSCNSELLYIYNGIAGHVLISLKLFWRPSLNRLHHWYFVHNEYLTSPCAWKRWCSCGLFQSSVLQTVVGKLLGTLKREQAVAKVLV